MKSKTVLLLVIIGLGILLILAFYISIEIQERKEANNGILGRILLGFQCSVVREGQTCPDNSFETRIHIFSLNNGKRELVKSVETDNNGNFSVNVVPGNYLVRPVGGNPFPACYEKEVNVFEDEFREVVLNCDTGIR